MKVFVVKLGHNALMHSTDRCASRRRCWTQKNSYTRTVTQVDLMIQQLDRMKYTM